MAVYVSRRGALCAAGVSLGLAATALGGALQAEISAKPVVLPSAEMALSRLIERELKDGNILSVERVWMVRFEERGTGFAVIGRQQSVAVDAPDRLGAIAKIEEGRSLDDMFPILLSDTGIILAAGNAYGAGEIQDAVAEAETLLNVSNMPPDHADQLQAMLANMAQASSRMIEVLPSDLFFPRQPSFEARRPLQLPSGEGGEFVLRYDTISDPATRLMRRAERQITTVIGAEKRRSREVWTLS